MSDDRDSFEDVETGRSYGTVALVGVVLVGVVLVVALLPAASSVVLADVPGSSLLPIPDSARGQGAGELGALNPGTTQPVGGSLASNRSAFRSQNTDVHFIVTSPEPSYWRTGAYDEYTGDGWRRDGDSNTNSPLDGETIRYSVELKRRATTAPTVWRPTEIDGNDALELTDGLTAESDSPLSAGSTYVGVSQAPPRNVSVLRASGREYPEGLADRYTELPDDTRDRVEPFASDLTADADTPYDTAVAIEQWLETNKTYSLDVEEPPDDDVATQFIFDMEAGYCEYFATSMVVMLRSQDIPARYVIGYSTGQQTGENTYTVRGMNAHAWVEVYFADVGWVRFDPTPGQARLFQEQQSYEANESGDYTPAEEGSPGEVESPTRSDSPGGTDGGGGGGSDGGTGGGTDTTPITASGDDSVSVTLNRTAVPGATVEVTVTQGGNPVQDATVRFNGDPVGQTRIDGTVVATVPYSDELNISVSGGTVVSLVGASPNATAPAAGDRYYSLDTADATAALADGTLAQTDSNVTQTFSVETDATVSVSGTVRTASTVVVTATVDGVPVRDAGIFVNDSRVATTDDQGRATVTLPETPGNVTLAVRRDPISGNTTLRLPALNVSVTTEWPLPVAGSPVRVVSYMGETPASGATVLVGDRAVGTTDVNGTAVASVPFAQRPTVGVAAAGQTVGETVSNPLLNTVAVVIAVGTTAGTTGLLLYRRGPRDLLRTARATVFATYRLLVRALVGSVFAIERAVLATVARTRRTLSYARSVLTGRLSPAAAAAAFRSWLGAWVTRVRERARAGVSTLGRDETDDEGRRSTVRTAWARFLSHLSVRRPETKTPGQLAAHGISVDDLPPRAVATLRDEFRAVEYGPRSDGDAAGAVRSAIETIESHVRSREESPDERDEGGDP